MSGGRHNKYESHVHPKLNVILGWLRSGYTEQSIANRLGVGESTWSRYKIAHPELREKILEGQLDIGALCVNNLFKRANGYTYDEIQTEVTEGGSSKGQAGARRFIKKVPRHVPPDVGANIFLLCNRDPVHFKNTQHIQHGGEVKGAGVLLTAPPMDKESWLKFYNQNVAQDGEPKPSQEPA